MSHKFKKQFGQNFLRDTESVIDLIYAAGITAKDNVLEIGPGNGSVTEYLVEKAKRVVAVEIDVELIPKLKERFKDSANFSVLLSDILELNPKDVFKGEPYKVVGSLPYNISKPIIKKFLTADNPPVCMSVLIQKEVSQDYAARPPKAMFLGTFARIYARIKAGKVVEKSKFYPTPKVDGQILTFSEIHKPKDAETLVKFIKLGYTSPRKKLSSNLANYEYDKAKIESFLTKENLTSSSRASELTPAQWYNLHNYLAN
jgi:16S rRNA (adenine1518-N6/adenine1519-N6)-dimethyltransferase